MKKTQKNKRILYLMIIFFIVFFTGILEKKLIASGDYSDSETRLELIEKAKEKLENYNARPKPYKFKKTKGRLIKFYRKEPIIVIAVYSKKSGKINLIEIKKGKSDYYGFTVKNKIKIFTIIQKEGYIVLCAKKVKILPNRKIKETIIVSPYANELKKYNAVYRKPSEFTEEELDNFKNVIINARNELRYLRVPSKAFLGKFVGEGVPLGIITIINIIEHTGHKSLLNGDKDKFIKRVREVINTKEELNKARSFMGAAGRFQIMKYTYKDIREFYPKANLIEDFRRGAKDPDNAAKAALCLIDYNISILLDNNFNFLKKNKEITPELLAASYNCGAGRVSDSIKYYGKNWKQNLPTQTKLYLLKYSELYKILYSSDELTKPLKENI